MRTFYYWFFKALEVVISQEGSTQQIPHLYLYYYITNNTHPIHQFIQSHKLPSHLFIFAKVSKYKRKFRVIIWLILSLIVLIFFNKHTSNTGMEDEDPYFYQSERDFFGQNSQANPYNYTLQHPTFFNKNLSLSSQNKHENDPQQIPFALKAYNPMERFKQIHEDKHYFMHMFSKHKGLNGIQHFFSFGEQDEHRGEFLQNIESDALGDNSMSDFQLDKLFEGKKSTPHRQKIQNNLDLLSKKIQQINQKTIGSINFSKTVSQSFYQHFQNFSIVLNNSTFIQEFQQNFKGMIGHCRKFKPSGNQLVLSIYEFWMKSFKDFINEIGRYSSKFTLNFFKKNAQEVDSSHNCSNIQDMRSQSSNTIGSKQKRKGWSKQETEHLQRCIDQNIIFTQSVLKTLATQLGRSSTSISSKIQKLIKCKKGEQAEEDSLMKKAIQILQMNSQGLTRQTIIQKLNENYEMGYGGQWQKSVGQLLSSQKEFIKIRGKHKLINAHFYKQISLQNEERSKLTFKDKVIQIFLTMPNYEADLKTLAEKYCLMFVDGQFEGDMANQQRRKTIEGNISKTLSRYDIFDNSNAKTKYLLNPLLNKTEQRNMDLQVSDYFTL